MESEDGRHPGIRRFALRRPGLLEAALRSRPRRNFGRFHRTRPHTDHHALPEVAITALAFVSSEYRPRPITAAWGQGSRGFIILQLRRAPTDPSHFSSALPLRPPALLPSFPLSLSAGVPGGQDGSSRQTQDWRRDPG